METEVLTSGIMGMIYSTALAEADRVQLLDAFQRLKLEERQRVEQMFSEHPEHFSAFISRFQELKQAIAQNDLAALSELFLKEIISSHQ